ncbi:class I tRNA ligase family protein [Streptomyces paradoxus]|uniref:class I tRNA ligase family protein n=1 Tax=Streptomyces paradoxus TaxID=66375 RepID=UPI00381B8D06
MSSASWLITATPPTPNGDLHLGHLSGPYLAADVMARRLRAEGADVLTLTGIDDNQSYTEAFAVREGVTAATTASWFGDRIVRAWERAGLRYDVIGRPDRDAPHRELTARMFRQLYEQGDIVARTRPLPYCGPCERWAFEAYVAGTCPHCGTRSCGNACEVCGRPNDCADLGDPVCTVCGTPCETRDCERLYLPLERHTETLRGFWAENRMNGHLTDLCHTMAAEGLPEIAVSHPASWGLPVPVQGFEDQRVYVWFEMAAGYLAAGAAGADSGPRGPWGGGRRVVQCFGYDNGYFHAVLFPAVMRAFDPGVPLPTDFVSNEFYRLDGLKFSTSRRHAVWLLDVLDDVPADHLRIQLNWERPAVEQTDFTWDSFDTRVNRGALTRWHRWLVDLARRCEAADATPTAPGSSPPAGPAATVARLRRGTDETLRAVAEAYRPESFAPDQVLDRLDLLVRQAAATGTDLERLAGRPGGLHEALVECVRAELAAAAAFAAGLYPVAPAMAQQLWTALGCPGSVEENGLRWAALAPSDVKVGELAGECPLFLPGSRRV